MKNIITIIALFFITFLVGFTALLYPFSRKPKWTPVKREQEIKLFNVGDLPLEIYSMDMFYGKTITIKGNSFTIQPSETVSVYILIGAGIDTLTINSNDPDTPKKVLIQYGKIREVHSN